MKTWSRTSLFALCICLAQPVCADLKVATSIEDLASVAGYVGGNHVTVVSLTKGFQNPHFTPAKPSLMRIVRDVDVYVSVGLDLDAGWLALVLPGSRNPRIQPGAPGFVDASEGMKVLEEHSGPVSRAEGDVHPLGNPHYYMDPLNLKIVASHLEEVFSKLDPSNAGDYRSNTMAFDRRLEKAFVGWQRSLAPFQGHPVVTYHHNYPYFLERFGLELIATVEPKPGIPPSPRYLNDLAGRMKSSGCRAILYQPYFEEAICRKLAQNTGAKALEVPSEVGGVEEAKDVFSKFDLVVSRLAQVLGKNQERKMDHE